MVLPETVKSTDGRKRRPLRNTVRSVDGLGAFDSAKIALVPFAVPVGISPSMNTIPLPPEAPQAPDVPSTWRQSPRLPVAASIEPPELITAARDTEKPDPAARRRFSSPASPVT